MKFLLIGHTVKDTIRNSRNVTVKPGGLFYSTLALKSITSDEDEIFLLTSYDKENFEILEPLYSKCNLSFSKTVDKMPGVTLTLFDDREREEEYENITDKLDIQPVLDAGVEFDGILINMITGFDLNADDVKKLRGKFDCPVYFDVHSLSRGIDDKGKRYFRKIPQAEQWLENVDIVQANENEIKTLSGSANEVDIAKSVVTSREKILLETLGKRGVRTYFNHKGEIASLFLKATEVNSVNQVGCGDVFGASFFYSYISKNDLFYSLRFANTAAGIVTSYLHFDEYAGLKDDIEKMLKA